MGVVDTTVIFEGIGTLDSAEGVAHDVYLKIRTECIPGAVRWFGEFEWMGEKPANFMGGGFHDLVLSDGRETKIRVARFFAEDSGSYLFQGIGLPPGFEVFAPEMMTSQNQMDPVDEAFYQASQWRAHVGRLLFFLGFAVTLISVWEDDPNQTRLVWSGGFLWLMSMVMFSAQSTRDRKAQEVMDNHNRVGINADALKKIQTREGDDS